MGLSYHFEPSTGKSFRRQRLLDRNGHDLFVVLGTDSLGRQGLGDVHDGRLRAVACMGIQAGLLDRKQDEGQRDQYGQKRNGS